MDKQDLKTRIATSRNNPPDDNVDELIIQCAIEDLNKIGFVNITYELSDRSNGLANEKYNTVDYYGDHSDAQLLKLLRRIKGNSSVIHYNYRLGIIGRYLKDDYYDSDFQDKAAKQIISLLNLEDKIEIYTSPESKIKQLLHTLKEVDRDLGWCIDSINNFPRNIESQKREMKQLIEKFQKEYTDKKGHQEFLINHVTKERIRKDELTKRKAELEKLLADAGYKPEEPVDENNGEK